MQQEATDPDPQGGDEPEEQIVDDLGRENLDYWGRVAAAVPVAGWAWENHRHTEVTPVEVDSLADWDLEQDEGQAAFWAERTDCTESKQREGGTNILWSGIFWFLRRLVRTTKN